MIIDIHSHLVRKDGFYKIDELLEDMKKNNIDLRVISTLQGASIKEANRNISNLVEAHKDKLIGCAVVNPKLDSAIEDTKDALSLNNIKMVEFDSLEHGYYPDSVENIDDVLDLIEEKGLPVKVFTGLGSRAIPHQWEVVAKRHKKINFIFLHIGCFDYGYSCVDIANRNENIFVETSNQYEMQILRKTFENLDDSKVLFGSLYPSRLTKCAISIFDTFELKEEKLKAIFSDNAKKILNL